MDYHGHRGSNKLFEVCVWNNRKLLLMVINIYTILLVSNIPCCPLHRSRASLGGFLCTMPVFQGNGWSVCVITQCLGVKPLSIREVFQNSWNVSILKPNETYKLNKGADDSWRTEMKLVSGGTKNVIEASSTSPLHVGVESGGRELLGLMI